MFEDALNEFTQLDNFALYLNPGDMIEYIHEIKNTMYEVLIFIFLALI